MRQAYNFSFKSAEFPEETQSALGSLVGEFYGPNKTYSGATSSHWQKYGHYQNAEFHNNEFLELKGLGFGDYENRQNLKFFNYLINIPMTIAVQICLMGLSKDSRILIKDLAVKSKRLLNPDFLRLAFLSQNISKHIKKNAISKVMIIGDGFGTLGSILSKIHPELTIVQVNLGRTLIFDLAFSSISIPHKSHILVRDLSYVIDHAINYLPAEDLHDIDQGIELFIAVESFQEMDIQTVQNYFKLMRLQTGSVFVYLVSRLRKILPDGTEVKLEEYGWNQSDEILFNTLPWYVNWGVRRRPPFIFRMDGKTVERLVSISK
jgi:hypothetical protein